MHQRMARRGASKEIAPWWVVYQVESCGVGLDLRHASDSGVCRPRSKRMLEKHRSNGLSAKCAAEVGGLLGGFDQLQRPTHARGVLWDSLLALRRRQANAGRRAGWIGLLKRLERLGGNGSVHKVRGLAPVAGLRLPVGKKGRNGSDGCTDHGCVPQVTVRLRPCHPCASPGPKRCQFVRVSAVLERDRSRTASPASHRPETSQQLPCAERDPA